MAKKKHCFSLTLWTSLLCSTFFSHSFTSPVWAVEGLPSLGEEGGSAAPARRVAEDAEEKVRLQADTDLFVNCLRRLPEAVSLPVQEVFILYDRRDPLYKERTKLLCAYLHQAGIPLSSLYYDLRPGDTSDVHQHADKILTSQKVIVLGGASLKEEYESRTGTVAQEINNLRTRMATKGSEGIILTFFDGDFGTNYPESFKHLVPRELGHNYHLAFFEILMDLCPFGNLDSIRKVQEEFARLRQIPSEMLQAYGARLLKFQHEEEARKTA